MPDQQAPAPPAAPPSDFVAFLSNVEDGVLRLQLNDELRDLVSAMQRQAQNAGGKPVGKLAVAFTLKLDGGIIEVVADVKAVAPKPIRQKSVFWPIAGGALSKQNPRQIEMPLNTAATQDERPLRALS